MGEVARTGSGLKSARRLPISPTKTDFAGFGSVRLWTAKLALPSVLAPATQALVVPGQPVDDSLAQAREIGPTRGGSAAGCSQLDSFCGGAEV